MKRKTKRKLGRPKGFLNDETVDCAMTIKVKWFDEKWKKKN